MIDITMAELVAPDADDIELDGNVDGEGIILAGTRSCE